VAKKEKGKGEKKPIGFTPKKLHRNPAATAEEPVPQGVGKLLQDIAAWYTSDTETELHMQDTSYTKRNGLWLYGELIVVPECDELQHRCIELHHDGPYAGHTGRNNTLELIQRQFWWSTLRGDVHHYVANCVSCQRNKTHPHKPAGLLQPLAIPAYPWQSVSMDIITHLPCTARGLTAIVVFVDRLTKMVHFAPYF